jgi:hypothetical protein
MNCIHGLFAGAAMSLTENGTFWTVSLGLANLTGGAL